MSRASASLVGSLRCPSSLCCVPITALQRSREKGWADALAAEFASRDVEFSEPLKDTSDGLRGFELRDSDGYVLFFGRPRS
jgi:hypothetical protein